MSMRHRITIQHDTAGDGEEEVYGTFLDDVPCDIIPVNGGERYRGKQLQADTTIVIETRWYTGIHQRMQAVNKETSDVYYFHKVLADRGRKRFLMIEATEAD